MHIFTHIYVYRICMNTYIHIYICLHIHIHIYVYKYVHIYMRIYLYVYIYIIMHLYLYLCISIHRAIWTCRRVPPVCRQGGAEDCKLTTWEPWSDCTKTCGGRRRGGLGLWRLGPWCELGPLSLCVSLSLSLSLCTRSIYIYTYICT